MTESADPPTLPRRVAIVGHRQGWIGSTGRLLAGLGIAVVASYTSSKLALSRLESDRPDLLVVQFGEENGEWVDSAVESLVLARERRPELKTIVFGESVDPKRIDAAFAAGAAAYVQNRAGAREVASAIRQAFAQSVYLSRPPSVASTVGGVRRVDETLTLREQEVLQLVAQGYTNAEAAKALFITEQTVKYHLSNIYAKLDSTNRTQASRWAHERGLMSKSPSHGQSGRA